MSRNMSSRKVKTSFLSIIKASKSLDVDLVDFRHQITFIPSYLPCQRCIALLQFHTTWTVCHCDPHCPVPYKPSNSMTLCVQLFKYVRVKLTPLRHISAIHFKHSVLSIKFSPIGTAQKMPCHSLSPHGVPLTPLLPVPTQSKHGLCALASDYGLLTYLRLSPISRVAASTSTTTTCPLSLQTCLLNLSRCAKVSSIVLFDFRLLKHLSQVLWLSLMVLVPFPLPHDARPSDKWESRPAKYYLHHHYLHNSYIRKTSKGLKRAFYPLKPLKLCFKAIKSFKIFKTRISLNFFFISLKIITFSTFFYLLRKLREIKHFDVLLMYPVHLISLCYATHLKVSSSLSFPPTAGQYNNDRQHIDAKEVSLTQIPCQQSTSQQWTIS